MHPTDIIYQAPNGAIQLIPDSNQETVWASLDQIALLFGRDKSVISRHIKNIFRDEELSQNQVVAFFATTASDGKTYQVEFFNLDMILSVWYRVNSKLATQFRKWSTKVLKQHITQWFTINSERIQHNHELFLKAVEDIKILVQHNNEIKTQDILDLIKNFSYTWFSLDRYDKGNFPLHGSKQEVDITSQELYHDLAQLKDNLINKWEATDLFAQENSTGNLDGIISNVFQSVFGADAYPTLEEKAAHLTYFIIKNRPFNDGNKRSGAFAFVRLLQKAGFNFQHKIHPETLATLTLLIATSDASQKDQMIWLILLLLSAEYDS
jgi:prophage maintenance system killer protein